MAFKQFRKPPRRSSTGRVSMAAYIYKSAGGDVSCARIGVSHDILQALGWNYGDTLRFAIGTGKDLGWLKISAGPDGNTLHSSKKSNPRAMGTVIVPRLADGKRHKFQNCPHKIRAGSLYVKVPDWCQASFMEQAA